jgi:hypothetical protein
MEQGMPNAQADFPGYNDDRDEGGSFTSLACTGGNIHE